MKKGIIRVDRFSGGQAPYPNRGPEGSFAFGRNLDIRNDRGTLRLNKAMTPDNDPVVDANMGELLKTGFVGTNGILYAYGDGGGIYTRNTSKVWTLEATDADGEIFGSCEFLMDDGGGFEKFMLYSTATKLKYDQFDASYTLVTTAGTFKRGTGFPHFMTQALGVVMITDGDYIAVIDNQTAFNNEALQLPTGITARHIKEDGSIVRIFCTTHDGRGVEFTWDGIEVTWLGKKDIQLEGLSSGDYFESGIVLEGNQQMRYYDGANLEPLVSLPGRTNVESHILIDNLLMMGVYGGNYQQTKGIYSFGRKDVYSPLALNLEYYLASTLTGDGDDGVIGMIVKHEGDIVVSWSDSNGETGVDLLAEDAVYDFGRYQSLRLDGGDSSVSKQFQRLILITEPIDRPEYEIKAFYKTNRKQADWIPLKMANGSTDIVEPTGPTSQNTKWVFAIQSPGEWIQIQLTLSANGADTSPEVIEYMIPFTSTDEL